MKAKPNIQQNILETDKWIKDCNNDLRYYPSEYPTHCFLYLNLNKCLYEIKEEGGIKQFINVDKTLKEAKETVANIIKEWQDNK